MSSKVRLKDTDRGFKQLLSNAKSAAKGAGVSVGVHAKEGDAQHKEKHPSGAPQTLLEVAIINEFGLGVPERSFLRAWMDQAEQKHSEALRKATALVLQGKRTLPEALELLGLKFTGELQQAIASNSLGLKANEKPTIDRKGSSTPLIDSGQLRQGITFVVHDGAKPA